MKLGNMLRALAGDAMRGRVAKVSVLADGTRSVVVKFGGEEPGARDLVPGVLCSLQIQEPAPAKRARPKAPPDAPQPAHMNRGKATTGPG